MYCSGGSARYNARPMKPWMFFLTAVAGWMNRRQQEAIAYCSGLILFQGLLRFDVLTFGVAEQSSVTGDDEDAVVGD